MRTARPSLPCASPPRTAAMGCGCRPIRRTSRKRASPRTKRPTLPPPSSLIPHPWSPPHPSSLIPHPWTTAPPSQISPESAQVDWALAKAYDEAGLKTEALQAGHAAVASAGGPAAIVRLAALYQDHDREAAAAGILATALRAAPNDEALMQEQARLSEAKGEAAAIAQYQRVLQTDASAWWYRLRLAELFQATGNLKSAAQVLRAGRELRPQDAHVCALLADVVREMGRSTEAI